MGTHACVCVQVGMSAHVCVSTRGVGAHACVCTGGYDCPCMCVSTCGVGAHACVCTGGYECPCMCVDRWSPNVGVGNHSSSLCHNSLRGAVKT